MPRLSGPEPTLGGANRIGRSIIMLVPLASKPLIAAPWTGRHGWEMDLN